MKRAKNERRRRHEERLKNASRILNSGADKGRRLWDVSQTEKDFCGWLVARVEKRCARIEECQKYRPGRDPLMGGD